MFELGTGNEISEMHMSENEGFKEIKPEEGMTFQEAEIIFREFFKSMEIKGNKMCEKINEYFSTYDERIMQTPREDSDRGKWEGIRGESKFIPYNQEIKDILAKYGVDGIVYKDGIPDFSVVSKATVEIENMSENRAENFKQCDEKCAEEWNKEARDGRTDWTARDVAKWRKENGYSWHERNDMKTCDLISTKINDYFGHLGGVSECRKRDAFNDGGDFDE